MSNTSMSAPQPPAVIVLAAGRSRRFAKSDGPSATNGGEKFVKAPHKLDQTLGASTVFGITLANVLSSGLPFVVVVGPATLEQARGIVAARDIVALDDDGGTSTQDSGYGMGRSIAAGVQARAQAAGWLVMPADMPLVKPQTIRQVAEALRHNPIVYPQHRGQRGHPVGFSSELYSELINLRGDEGARRVVARYPSTGVEVDDAGVLMDVDTSEDLSLVRAVHAADQALADVGRASNVRESS